MQNQGSTETSSAVAMIGSTARGVWVPWPRLRGHGTRHGQYTFVSPCLKKPSCEARQRQWQALRQPLNSVKNPFARGAVSAESGLRRDKLGGGHPRTSDSPRGSTGAPSLFIDATKPRVLLEPRPSSNRGEAPVLPFDGRHSRPYGLLHDYYLVRRHNHVFEFNRNLLASLLENRPLGNNSKRLL